MKSLFLFCLLTCWAKPTHHDPIRLDLDHCDLVTALHSLQELYGCYFAYVETDVVYKDLHLHIANVDLQEAIRETLSGLPLEGVITDSSGGMHVTLRKKAGTHFEMDTGMDL